MECVVGRLLLKTTGWKNKVSFAVLLIINSFLVSNIIINKNLTGVLQIKVKT